MAADLGGLEGAGGAANEPEALERVLGAGAHPVDPRLDATPFARCANIFLICSVL